MTWNPHLAAGKTKYAALVEGKSQQDSDQFKKLAVILSERGSNRRNTPSIQLGGQTWFAPSLLRSANLIRWRFLSTTPDRLFSVRQAGMKQPVQEVFAIGGQLERLAVDQIS